MSLHSFLAFMVDRNKALPNSPNVHTSPSQKMSVFVQYHVVYSFILEIKLVLSAVNFTA